MKGLALSLLCAALFISAAGQNNGAAIRFNETRYEFGTISSRGGKVRHIFRFTNTGDVPLVITKINISCTCTKAEYRRTPVPPGKTDSITVTYNPRGKNGFFANSIQVYTNTAGARDIIAITGNVTK